MKSGGWIVCCNADHAADWAIDRTDLGPRRLGFTALNTKKAWFSCMHCALCGALVLSPPVRCVLHTEDCPPYSFEASLAAFHFPKAWDDFTGGSPLTDDVWCDAAAIAEDCGGILTASEIVYQIVIQ